VRLGDALRAGDAHLHRAHVGRPPAAGQELQHAVAVAVIRKPRHRPAHGVRHRRQAALDVERLRVGDALRAGHLHPQGHVPVGVVGVKVQAKRRIRRRVVALTGELVARRRGPGGVAREALALATMDALQADSLRKAILRQSRQLPYIDVLVFPR